MPAGMATSSKVPSPRLRKRLFGAVSLATSRSVRPSPSKSHGATPSAFWLALPARRVRHVDEAAAAGVAVEARRRARVALGRAVGLRASVERAEEVAVGAPVDVPADVEVEPAVGVEVEPGRGSAPSVLADPGLRGDLLEAPAEVVEEEVAVEGRHVDVVTAVVVVVRHGGPHAVEDPLETGLAGDVAEPGPAVRVVALVAVEREGGLLGRRSLVPRPEGARDEEEVGPGVAVVVEHGRPAAHRLGHPLLAAAPLTCAKSMPIAAAFSANGIAGAGVGLGAGAAAAGGASRRRPKPARGRAGPRGPRSVSPRAGSYGADPTRGAAAGHGSRLAVA